MKLNRDFKSGLATALLFQMGLMGPATAKQDDGEHLKELVVQAVTTKSLEHASLNIQTVKGDEAAQRARQIGKDLVALSGKPIRVRIGRGENVPIALEHGEIVIPEYGMNNYSPGEMNFMMAHELAHIVLKHGSARIRLAAESCPSFEGNSLSYIEKLGACIDKNFKEASEFAPILRRLRWRQEHEADMWAVRFLSKHNLPAEYRTMLGKTAYSQNIRGTDTHPPVHKRLEVIEQMITNQMP